MNAIILKNKRSFVLVFLLIASIVMSGGCARYAKSVNMLYEPATTIGSGKGDLFIIIPDNRLAQSPNIEWVIGKVKDDENRVIDQVLSPRSPAQIFQEAFTQEFKRAGYTVIPATKRSGDEQLLLDLTKADIKLEQTSAIPDIKATCRVQVGVDVFKNGQEIKRLQYEASSTKIDIKDRDLLAGTVLQDTLQAVMLKAVPELHHLFFQ